MTNNTMREASVCVCPIKDSVCGDTPNLWCTTCPKKFNKMAHDCPTCRQAAQMERKHSDSVPVGGEPVECLMCGGSGDSRQPQCCGKRESDGACCGYPDPEMCYQCEGTGVIYRKSVKSIPAAELATLREKAAVVDELARKLKAHGNLYIRAYSPLSDMILDAAIAQGKGE